MLSQSMLRIEPRTAPTPDHVSVRRDRRPKEKVEVEYLSRSRDGDTRSGVRQVACLPSLGPSVLTPAELEVPR